MLIRALGFSFFAALFIHFHSASAAKPAPASIDISHADEILFEEILRAYHSGQPANVALKIKKFLEISPASPFADNALYLKGLLELDRKDYHSALKDFAQVLEKYPFSNKSVSALFAKGVTYKRMGLSAQARSVFQQIRSRYPGSSESFRAEAEMKILKKVRP